MQYCRVKKYGAKLKWIWGIAARNIVSIKERGFDRHGSEIHTIEGASQLSYCPSRKLPWEICRNTEFETT
jgi:hypothetical protein